MEFDGIQLEVGSSRRFSIQIPSIFARNAIVLSTLRTVAAGDRASPGRLLAPAATASCEPHLYQGHYVAKNEIMRYKFLFTGLNGPPQGPRAGRRRRSMGRPPNGARKTEEHHRAAPGAVMRFRVSAPQDEVVGSYFLLESLVTY